MLHLPVDTSSGARGGGGGGRGFQRDGVDGFAAPPRLAKHWGGIWYGGHRRFKEIGKKDCFFFFLSGEFELPAKFDEVIDIDRNGFGGAVVELRERGGIRLMWSHERESLMSLLFLCRLLKKTCSFSLRSFFFLYSFSPRDWFSNWIQIIGIFIFLLNSKFSNPK